MGVKIEVESERFKQLIHAESQIEIIRKSIEKMEPEYSAEEILEDIKLTLRL